MRFWLVILLLSCVFNAGAHSRSLKQDGIEPVYVAVLSIVSSRLNVKLHYHDFYNSLYDTKGVKSVVIADTSYFYRNIADSGFYDFHSSIDSNVYNNGWQTLAVTMFLNTPESDSSTMMLTRYEYDNDRVGIYSGRDSSVLFYQDSVLVRRIIRDINKTYCEERFFYDNDKRLKYVLKEQGDRIDTLYAISYREMLSKKTDPKQFEIAWKSGSGITGSPIERIEKVLVNANNDIVQCWNGSAQDSCVTNFTYVYSKKKIKTIKSINFCNGILPVTNIKVYEYKRGEIRLVRTGNNCEYYEDGLLIREGICSKVHDENIGKTSYRYYFQ